MSQQVGGLTVGARIWVPCKVKSGPFSNERRVLIDTGENEWFGFVSTDWLLNKEEEGDDQILVKVVSIEGDIFHAIVPGSAPQPALFEGHLSHVGPWDGTLETRSVG